MWLWPLKMTTQNFLILFVLLMPRNVLTTVWLRFWSWGLVIVRRSPPRHSPPQTFTTSDVHHPLCKIRRSPPQTFTTSDVHHLRRSPPQTFTTSDIHHPQCKIRRSPPQTFTTPDVHHLRRSPPQTFTTPFVKSDDHHPRRSPPQTFMWIFLLGVMIVGGDECWSVVNVAF